MKILVTTLLITLTIGTMANEKFEKVMGENIAKMFGAQDHAALTATINQLVRIGDAEKDKWEPYYYAAFGYIRLMQMNQDKSIQDQHLTAGLEQIEKADKIKPNESEITAMRGFIYMMQLTVDPASRGQQYSGMAFEQFQKATAQNPENPRAQYLLGQMQLGTAQFFGGGDGGSCATFEKAQTLIEREQLKSPIAPSWGIDGIIQALEGCKGNSEG
ncbi:MAG: hypothetical protein JXQ90_08790 [Cyclobacteriaceae bacterium]